MTIFAFAAIFGGGLVGLVVWLSYRSGRFEQRDDDNDRTSQAMAQAAHTRDRLVRDPAFAKRVRARFRR